MTNRQFVGVIVVNFLVVKELGVRKPNIIFVLLASTNIDMEDSKLKDMSTRMTYLCNYAIRCIISR